MSRKYHGWIVVEHEEGFRDQIFVEWNEGNTRKREQMGFGESGCAKAVEWWDKKLNTHVQLQPMLRGSYRVYIEEAE